MKTFLKEWRLIIFLIFPIPIGLIKFSFLASFIGEDMLVGIYGIYLLCISLVSMSKTITVRRINRIFIEGFISLICGLLYSVFIAYNVISTGDIDFIAFASLVIIFSPFALVIFWFMDFIDQEIHREKYKMGKSVLM